MFVGNPCLAICIILRNGVKVIDPSGDMYAEGEGEGRAQKYK